MAWIYLAELEESQSLLAIGSDLSHTVRSTPIVKEYSYHDNLKERSFPHQSGQTFGALRDVYSVGWLTSSTEDFHARTSLLQAMEKAWQESEADYFSRS